MKKLLLSLLILSGIGSFAFALTPGDYCKKDCTEQRDQCHEDGRMGCDDEFRACEKRCELEG